MKKITLTVLTALALCAAALTGCGRVNTLSEAAAANRPGGNTGSAAETSGADGIILSGKYTATQIDSAGTFFSAEAIGVTPENVYINFREDGTLTLHMLGNDIEGTYSGSGNTAAVTLENYDEPEDGDESDTTVLTLDGSKVIIGDAEGGTMTFEKE